MASRATPKYVTPTSAHAADGNGVTPASPLDDGSVTPASPITYVDPGVLLVDVNIRHDARMDPQFVASIKTLGVLQPIIAVRTPEGALRVRFGHRRTLAAIEAGHTSVPVLVAADESIGDAGQVERIVAQYAENAHRTGLTNAETVGVAAQLAAFGISAAQIAKRTRMPRTAVDAALTIAESDVAKAATMRYELTLDQAATVAEFQDDPDVVKALVAAAHTGQFTHVAQRARDARAERAERAAAEQALTDAGIRVLSSADLNGTPARLTSLTCDPDSNHTLTPDEHQDCPGHAATLTRSWVWTPRHDPSDTDSADPCDGQGDDTADPDVDEERDLDSDDEDDADDDEDDDEDGGGRYEWVTVWMCVDPAAYGHHSRFGSGQDRSRTPVADLEPEQREAAREARREVIDCNQSWASAETVRRDWLRTLAARKTPLKGTATFLARAHALDADVVAGISGNHFAADLLAVADTSYGRNTALPALIEGAGDARAQVIHLVMVLAAYEAATVREDWRSQRAQTRRYLTHLAAIGYTLSDVEQRACTERPPRT